MEELPLDEVVEGVNRELDLMKSSPVHQAVPRAAATGKVWSTRWCYKRKGPKQVRTRFVLRQFANSLDANFYTHTPGLEVTRVLLAMALSKDLTILFGDISVAFITRPCLRATRCTWSLLKVSTSTMTRLGVSSEL